MFYVVSIIASGMSAAVELREHDLLYTRVYRLSKEARNRLTSPRVALYAFLKRHAAFKIGDHYVLHESLLELFHSYFLKAKRKFDAARDQIYAELVMKWPHLRSEVEAEVRKRFSGEELERTLARLRRLDPPERPEDLASMSYTLVPLLVQLSPQSYVRLPVEVVETLDQARVRIEREIRAQYEARIAELESRAAELEARRRRMEAEIRQLRAVGRARESRDVNLALQGLIREEELLRVEAERVGAEVRDLNQIGVRVPAEGVNTLLSRLLRKRVGAEAEGEEAEAAQSGAAPVQP
jgi:hypothetical protein